MVCIHDFYLHMYCTNILSNIILLAHCTRASEIESADHWDGPLGGGNDLLRAGAINGWMFNHKGEFLMYETYINPKACKRIDNIMENCDAHGQNQLSHEEHQKIHKHILPIADGIAYDIHKRTFCKITNPHTLKHQVSFLFS